MYLSILIRLTIAIEPNNGSETDVMFLVLE